MNPTGISGVCLDVLNSRTVIDRSIVNRFVGDRSIGDSDGSVVDVD